MILLTLMMGLCTLKVSAQETVEIGTGTGTTYYGPFNSLWGYSFVEQIYTAEEIDMAGEITSISFYKDHGNGQTNNIVVYMKLVDRSSFSSNSDYEQVTAQDIVYQGSWEIPTTGWTTITLDTPFDYDGASNLMIAVHENTSGYTTQYFCYTAAANSMISFHSDSSDPDPYNLGAWSGTIYTQSNRPNIRMEIMPNGNNCYSPLAPAISDITAYEATLSWTPREDQSAWEVYCGTGEIDLEQVAWTLVTDTFYTFTDLTPATNYNAYVRTSCDVEVSNPRKVTFTTIATCPNVPGNVSVSNVTATSVDVNWVAQEDDYAWEVVVVPSGSTPESGIPVSADIHPFTVGDLNDATSYSAYVRTDCGGGDYSYWAGPVNFTTTPLCSSPVNVTISQIAGSSALVSWEAAIFGATSYTVEYSVAGQDDWIPGTVEGTQYMLANLEPTTTYDVMVYSNCDLSSADTIYKTFTTNCLVGGEVQIGNGTTTNYYLPVNNCYKYTYSQQIFLASEMNGAGEIHSVSFHYAYGTPMTKKTNVTIFLGHTTQSAFTSTSNYIPDTVLQQVYSGDLNCSQGWNTFTFTTPFQYNGTDNLVLAIDDNSNLYDGISYTFYVHSTSDNMSLYYYSDSSNPDPSSPSATSSSYNSGKRSNVKFGMDCEEEVTCVAPNVYVTEVSPESITIDWAPGYTETSWELEYGISDSDWISVGSVTAPYELENLTPDTKYYVRVRSNCGSENSGWMTLSVRTECSDITIPYMQDFDDAPASGAGNMVTCWTSGTNYTTAYPYTSSTQHHSGSYGVYFYGTPAYYSYIASPRIEENVAMDNLQVRFWAYKTSAAYNIQVGIMTDPNDYNTFVQIGQNISPSATSTWESFEVNTDSYIGEGRYIAFRIPAVSTSYMYIDDIVIDFIPECMRPTDLTSTTATNNSITLSWTAGDENDSGWEIVYGAPGFDPDTVTPVFADTNPFEVQGLDPATKYQFYVRTVCGTSDYSIWSLPMSFATECDVLSVPYSEDFNSYITTASSTTAPTGYPNNDMPLCWNFLNRNNSSSEYPIAFLTSSSTYAASGNCLFFKSSSTTPIYAVLPEFDANLNTLQITFTYRNEGTTEYNGTLSLGYMTDNLDATSFVELASYPRITALTEVTELLNGVPASDSTLYLAFKYTGGTNNNYYLSIDNITVDYMPDCPSPVKNSVTASDIDGHNATISFVDNDPEHDSWTVYYRAANAGEEDEWFTAVTNETSVILTGLDPETTYNVYVITNCEISDEEVDATNTIQFTTSVACPAPQNFEVTSHSSSTVTLSWFSNAESFIVEYGEAGFTPGTGTIVETYASFYDFTELNAATTYTVYVTADCGEDGTSSVANTSFTTDCVPLSLPYSENFNDYVVSVSSSSAPSTYPNDVMPLCWSFLNRSLTSSTYPSAFLTAYSSYAVSGNCLFFKSSSTTPLYAVLPDFDANLNTLQITFTYRNEGTGASNGTLSFGYMTNSADENTFVEISSYPQTTTLTEVNEVLSSLPENAASLAFKYTGGTTNNYYLSIDNIYIETIPTCPRPSDLTATASTSNSVTLSWTPGGSETSWEIIYGASGFDLETEGTTVPSVTTNPYTLTGLNSTTTYEIYVRANCGSGDLSNWSNSLLASTSMVAEALPYQTDFTTDQSWLMNNGAAPNYWMMGTPSGATESALFVTNDGSSVGYAISSASVSMAEKLFTMPATDSIHVVFDVQVGGEGSSTPYDYLKVFLAPSVVEFTPAAAASNTQSSYSYAENAFDFSNYQTSSYPYQLHLTDSTLHIDMNVVNPEPNGSAKIVFLWRNDGSLGDGQGAIIRNFSIDANGSGPVITNPTVATNAASGATQTTATLNATITKPDNVTVTAKGFEWKTTMGGTYASIAGTGTGNTFTASLTNLTPNTSYTFKAFITYDGTTVYGDEMTFNTLPEEVQPCDVPTGLEASNITKESFTVTWNNNANVSSWNIQYRPLNGQLSSAVANTNHYDFTNLTSETVYQVQVQANCGDGNLSEWSDILTVTTLVDAIESYLINRIALYPNPANEYVDVRIDGDVNVKSMEVFDVYGKLINTVNVIDNPTRINVSGLADGMYFVRVTTEQGVATKTFVKK